MSAEDEAVRRHLARHQDGSHGGGHDGPVRPEAPRRRLVELAGTEAMNLLASVDYGRIVFTQKALPAIRPVNHVIVNGEIFVRTRLHAKLAVAVDVRYPTVVAYEADELDPVNRLGWSVVVTGYARAVTDPAELSRLEHMLQPWVESVMDAAVAIRPEIVTGFRLVETPGAQTPTPA